MDFCLVKSFDMSKMHDIPKLPHMGWNDISLKEHSIFDGVDKQKGFIIYIHIFQANKKENVIATSFYQHQFDCAINHENI